MNSSDKTQTRLALGALALGVALYCPKAAAVVAVSAILIVGGMIYAGRSLQG